MKKNNKTFLGVFIIVLVLVICLFVSLFLHLKKGKETEETEEPTTEFTYDEGAYYLNHAVNGATFLIRNQDIKEDAAFNPSSLNDMVSPLYYWVYAWVDDNGNHVQYEDEPIDMSGAVILNTESVYSYSSESFSYDCGVNDAYTTSLFLVSSKEDFMNALANLSLDNATLITGMEDDSFKNEKTGNDYRCSMNVSYYSRTGEKFTGVAVMLENDDGQSYFVCGGLDFTDTDLETLKSGFSLTDNVSDMISHYGTSDIEYDLGGYRVSGSFSNVFQIDPSKESWYTNRCGFPELFSANGYARVSTLFGVYYMPNKVSTSEFLSAYSPFLYPVKGASSQGGISDSDGREWERFTYNRSEVSSLNRTVLYVYTKGQYVFLFGLYYKDTNLIDYSLLMDAAISTLHIEKGDSKAYTDSSDFFYNNLGVATNTDAGKKDKGSDSDHKTDKSDSKTKDKSKTEDDETDISTIPEEQQATPSDDEQNIVIIENRDEDIEQIIRQLEGME